MRTTVFCQETRDFAVIEDGNVIDIGVVGSHQGDWFFLDEHGQITEKVYAEFNRDPLGGGLYGPKAPELTADKVYKRANAFLKALANQRQYGRLQSR